MIEIKIIKRDCSEVDFDKEKIYEAIMKAMTFGSGVIRADTARDIANEIEFEAQDRKDLDIYWVENKVFEKLIDKHQILTAKSYEGYRRVREYQRDVRNSTDDSVMELLAGKSEYWNEENSNKNATLVTTQRDYMAGIESEDISKRFLLTPDVVQAHEEGIIHFHDIDYFAQKALHNCDLVNLEDMLQNGTVISDTMIEKPHSFSTACNIAMQVVAQVASSQFGGQSITLTHLAPFVDVSRQNIRKETQNELKDVHFDTEEEKQNLIENIVQSRLQKEINKGVQTIQYQVVTLLTTNGQAPFLSVFMYLNEAKDEQTKADLALIIEEVLKQRIQGVKNEQGVWITPAFPKLLYVLEDDNTYEGSKYFYLTELAAKCTAKRMVPDYISEKKMLEYKVDKNGNGNCYPAMGCRSFLTPYVDPETNKPKYYGRFNCGVVTINLPDIALSSKGDYDMFWKLFETRTELCHKALQLRIKRLEGTPSDVAPILWQYGALARLKKGEKIDKLLRNGYATISLGYAGLYECVKYMTGHSHTDEGVGEAFGLKVMQALNDKCNQWKAAEHIDYSLYGSPIETTTYKFAKCLKKRFGVIEGITDRNYITNSYHVPVFEEIDAFEKLRIEAKFQKLSPGGAISYVEVPNLTDNIPVIIQIIQYIYETIVYAELNTKSDYCQVCGYDKEIKIITDEKTGRLIWECPNCGNRDQNKMNVSRRSCGKE
ncbi:MAG: anaerobic ribonucleoside-triphosphate reductase [Dialister sp.]|uniref:anaerobic ribonucleoside-triphosphate reductase n=1 Tax=Dialister sp. TaxID=1955814 RepID=UPI001DED80DA|nr:anaerobic ribonucleoside-triphosphate reductase [Dialister sp.]MBS6715338.1 anaerobic ribonucleoside-triphosphate reductase [Dialister sp.]